MHDPEERPRFRWRMLAWGSAALILTPVLYIAMVGPVQWWDFWHSRDPGWFANYYRTLQPLYQGPSLGPHLLGYGNWWRGRPAPRSWKRARLVEEIAQTLTNITVVTLAEQRQEERAAQLDAAAERGKAALANGPTLPADEVKIDLSQAGVQEAIEEARDDHSDSPGYMRKDLEARLKILEQRLRQLSPR